MAVAGSSVAPLVCLFRVTFFSLDQALHSLANHTASAICFKASSLASDEIALQDAKQDDEEKGASTTDDWIGEVQGAHKVADSDGHLDVEQKPHEELLGDARKGRGYVEEDHTSQGVERRV